MNGNEKSRGVLGWTIAAGGAPCVAVRLRRAADGMGRRIVGEDEGRASSEVADFSLADVARSSMVEVAVSE